MSEENKIESSIPHVDVLADMQEQSDRRYKRLEARVAELELSRGGSFGIDRRTERLLIALAMLYLIADIGIPLIVEVVKACRRS